MRAFLLLIYCLGCVSCGVYSFSGISVPPGAKTASVSLFPNQASQVNPSLSQTFTQILQKKVERDTPLRLVEEEGDLSFSGAIVGYTVSSVAAGGGDQSKLNRLTISVKVEFLDRIDNKEVVKTIDQFADFDQGVNLSSVEESLVNDICILLVDEIFNSTLGNW